MRELLIMLTHGDNRAPDVNTGLEIPIFYHLVFCYFSIGKQGLGTGTPGKGKAWEEDMKRLT